MEEIRVVHPRFQTRVLTVRPSLFAAKLMLDGQVVARGSKGRHELKDDSDRLRVVRLRAKFDVIPVVEIDGEPVVIAPPLAWYQYVWCAWPVVLIFIGGAVGGGLGGVAAATNLRIMRSEQSALARYAFTAALGIAAVLVYALVAGALHVAMSR